LAQQFNAKCGHLGKQAKLELTCVDVVKQFVDLGRRTAKDGLFFSGIKVEMIHGDAAHLGRLQAADLLIHEVFGQIASSESFTAFTKNIGKNTVVLPGA
jgi:hypothetical protein